MTTEADPSFDLVDFYFEQPHFLQSSAWGSFQEACGNEVIREQGLASDGGSWKYLAFVEKGSFSSRLYCPYGPVFSSPVALNEALSSLEGLTRSRGLEFARIEPRAVLSSEYLRSLKLKPSAHDVQPPNTIITDVRVGAVTEDDILMRAWTSRRQGYRYCLRDGVEFKLSYNPEDIDHFLDMIHVVAKRTGMQPHEDIYFKTMAQVLFPLKAAGMLLACLKDEPLASVIFYSDGTTMGYAHAGSFDVHRKLSLPASLFMHLQLFARQSGHALVDTYGVAPEGAPEDHPWAGFTKFKESWGGVRVHYPGTWELPVSKLRYTVYNAVGKLLER